MKLVLHTTNTQETSWITSVQSVNLNGSMSTTMQNFKRNGHETESDTRMSAIRGLIATTSANTASRLTSTRQCLNSKMGYALSVNNQKALLGKIGPFLWLLTIVTKLVRFVGYSAIAAIGYSHCSMTISKSWEVPLTICKDEKNLLYR